MEETKIVNGKVVKTITESIDLATYIEQKKARIDSILAFINQGNTEIQDTLTELSTLVSPTENK